MGYRSVCHNGHALVAVAQLVRAPGCGPGGRGFEPRRSPSSPFGGLPIAAGLSERSVGGHGRDRRL